MPSIVFKDVDYAYVDNNETYVALEGIDLEISDGEFVCLVGHSGCGKSTMLSLIAGLEMPTHGQVLIDGRVVDGPGPDRSIVFQNYSLFPWQTAVKNVMFAMQQTNKGIDKSESESRARALLEKVGVGDAADRYPFQLSGGMRQRVAIARALAIDAPIMLLDLWEGSCCKTAVFVTHDIDEALILADRIVFMEPKHVIKSFNLPKGRDRVGSPEVEVVKAEVLELFEATATGKEDEE